VPPAERSIIFRCGGHEALHVIAVYGLAGARHARRGQAVDPARGRRRPAPVMNLVSRPPADLCRTFRTGRRGGVWFVTKDHAFYGDYLSHDQALESACYGARAVQAKGGSARVLDGPDEVVVPHQAPGGLP
jgi:hypothetical protein